MIIKNKTKEHETNLEGGVEMKLSKKGASMAISIIRDRIYTDKVWAVVREYGANAGDEHKKHGVTQPVEFKTVRGDNPSIHIRDFAKGLDKNGIENVFSQYFESTKTGDEIGGYGIGSKCALAYTDSFTVVSNHEGLKSIYMFMKYGEDSKVHAVSETPTTDTGIEVIVPIKYQDSATFESRIHQLAFTMKVPISLNGVLLEDYDAYMQTNKAEINLYNFGGVEVIHGKSGNLRSKFSNYNSHVVNAGGIAYKIDARFFESCLEDAIVFAEKTHTFINTGLSVSSLKSANDNTIVYINVGVNSVDIPPSREFIEETPLSKRGISRVLATALVKVDEFYDMQSKKDYSPLTLKELIALPEFSDNDDIPYYQRATIDAIQNNITKSNKSKFVDFIKAKYPNHHEYLLTSGGKKWWVIKSKDANGMDGYSTFEFKTFNQHNRSTKKHGAYHTPNSLKSLILNSLRGENDNVFCFCNVDTARARTAWDKDQKIITFVSSSKLAETKKQLKDVLDVFGVTDQIIMEDATLSAYDRTVDQKRSSAKTTNSFMISNNRCSKEDFEKCMVDNNYKKVIFDRRSGHLFDSLNTVMNYRTSKFDIIARSGLDRIVGLFCRFESTEQNIKSKNVDGFVSQKIKDIEFTVNSAKSFFKDTVYVRGLVADKDFVEQYCKDNKIEFFEYNPNTGLDSLKSFFENQLTKPSKTETDEYNSKVGGFAHKRRDDYYSKLPEKIYQLLECGTIDSKYEMQYTFDTAFDQSSVETLRKAFVDDMKKKLQKATSVQERFALESYSVNLGHWGVKDMTSDEKQKESEKTLKKLLDIK